LGYAAPVTKAQRVALGRALQRMVLLGTWEWSRGEGRDYWLHDPCSLESVKIKARLADVGATPFIGSPSDLGKFVADETEKWAKVVKFAGIKPE
jgi:hypothetical protein